MSSYRDSLENFLKILDVDAGSVLDIGGGAWPVKRRVRTWNVSDYKIMDNSAEDEMEIVHYEHDINFDIPVKDKKAIGHFDLVFCLEVFEYIFDPVVALSNIRYFMKDNGRAYITFPTLYPLHNPEGIDYLRYQRDGIEQLMDQCNLTVEQVIPRMPTNDGLLFLKNFYASEGFHARKHTNDIYSLGYIYRVRK